MQCDRVHIFLTVCRELSQVVSITFTHVIQVKNIECVVKWYHIDTIGAIRWAVSACESMGGVAGCHDAGTTLFYNYWPVSLWYLQTPWRQINTRPSSTRPLQQWLHTYHSTNYVWKWFVDRQPVGFYIIAGFVFTQGKLCMTNCGTINQTGVVRVFFTSSGQQNPGVPRRKTRLYITGYIAGLLTTYICFGHISLIKPVTDGGKNDNSKIVW